jgi:hypothetical protein
VLRNAIIRLSIALFADTMVITDINQKMQCWASTLFWGILAERSGTHESSQKFEHKKAKK